MPLSCAAGDRVPEQDPVGRPERRLAVHPGLREPDRVEADELRLAHLGLGEQRIRRPRVVLGRADEHVRAAREGRSARTRGTRPARRVGPAQRAKSTLSDPMPSERIEAQLKRVPAAPGVYLFRDEAGTVLYVGKAKTLRPRVRSYFQAGSSDTRQGIRAMANRVETIETIVTRARSRRCTSSRTSSSVIARRSTCGCATTSRSRTSRSPSRTTTRASCSRASGTAAASGTSARSRTRRRCARRSTC